MKEEQDDKQENDLKEVTLSAEECRKLQAQAGESQEYLDKLLRLHAEFENYKKRAVKEREQFIKFANEGLISELLMIMDNFERAFASANSMSDFKSLHQGVEMILKQIHELLNNNGVKQIECVGKPFDPAQQEAIDHVETDEYPENTVVEEVQKGYLINERIIRPAVVKVAKGKKEDRIKD